jgi:hypothetical protein
MLRLWRVDNLKTIKILAKDLIQGSITAICTSKYAAVRNLLMLFIEIKIIFLRNESLLSIKLMQLDIK